MCPRYSISAIALFFSTCGEEEASIMKEETSGYVLDAAIMGKEAEQPGYHVSGTLSRLCNKALLQHKKPLLQR